MRLRTSRSSSRVSMASAPCPTAGRTISRGSTSVMRSAKPRRLRPATARMMASKCSRSSFSSRVLTLPRRSEIWRSGRACSSCALRRRLDVPTFAPCGRFSSVLYFGLTTASPGSKRSVMAEMTSPSGTSVGISLRLCTAMSMPPASISCSSSFVKSPLPPILASGASRILSPFVVMSFFSTRSSG